MEVPLYPNLSELLCSCISHVYTVLVCWNFGLGILRISKIPNKSQRPIFVFMRELVVQAFSLTLLVEGDND
jgi:hypothetical protein